MQTFAASLIVFVVVLAVSQCAKNGTIEPKRRLYNPLVCYVEVEGLLYGEEFHEESHHEPCAPQSKFCQKITAHFMDTSAVETHINMKGCDTVQVLPHFQGIACQGTGCIERIYNDDLFTVCCCNTETCNPGKSHFSILMHILLFIIYCIVSELLSLIFIYTVITKSTNDMKTYKFVLLKFLVCVFLFNCSLTNFVRPDLLCPLTAAAIRSPIGGSSEISALVIISITLFLAISVFISIIECCFVRVCILFQWRNMLKHIFSWKGLILSLIIHSISFLVVLCAFNIARSSSKEFLTIVATANLSHMLGKYLLKPNTVYIYVNLFSYNAIPLVMAELKEHLKAASILLKNENHEEALKLLEPHISNGVKNYMLYCYAGLCYSNANVYDMSLELFRQATEIDKEKPMAWKGIFKIIDHLPAEVFLIKVCDAMLAFPENEGKSGEILDAKLRILLKIQDFNLINENWKKDPKFLKSNEQPVVGQIEKLSKNFPEKLSDSTLQKFIFKITCEELFCNGTFPIFSDHLVESQICLEPMLNLINHLRSNDITHCLEILDKIENVEKSKYPQCLLFVKLLEICENWCECKQIVDYAKKNATSPEILKHLEGWKARICLETFEKIDVNIQRPLPTPEFIREETNLCLMNHEEQSLNGMLSKYSENTKEGMIIRLQISLKTNQFPPENLNMTEALLSRDDADWKDALLVAEVRIAMKSEATSILVKAAKLNPRSSRVFHILGKSLLRKNPAKAKSCLERAFKIQPGNEEYAKCYDECLVQQNASSSERIAILKKFAQCRGNKLKPMWLSKALAELYLENEQFDSAIEELQQLVRFSNLDKLSWARLADAYFRKGHLRAAVSSYEHLSEIDGGRDYRIPMIRVLVQLRDFEVALEKVNEYRELVKCDEDTPRNTKIAIDILEVQIRFNLLSTTTGDDRRENLRTSIRILSTCVQTKSNISLIYKLAGDCLLKASEYSERFLPYFEIDPSWNVTDRSSCAATACSFYATVLQLRKTDALSWHDMAVALIFRYNIEKNPEFLKKAKKFVENAFKYTNDSSILSTLWTVLARAKNLANDHPNEQLHCLTRALQLNKTNDSAWLMLAVLCLIMFETNAASFAVEQAIKYNPHNADAWCTWAQHANLFGSDYDALVMFRQSLCIKPTASSIVGYCVYLCRSLRNSNSRFDSAVVALNFEPIIQLREMACCDKRALRHLGVLADFFGYYSEAVECLRLAGASGAEFERMTIKLDTLSDGTPKEFKTEYSENSRLSNLVAYSNEQLWNVLLNELPVYAQLMSFINEQMEKEFKAFYLANFKVISVPLLVSAIISLRIEMPIGFIEAMHEALPRHELIDYFPTILPPGLDNGLSHLEQDGEEPFRYKHKIAKKLYEELKLAREKYEALAAEECA
ncbi:unnamed protein product [Caenorhabditis bovis]|uniref:Tetratricopeptide repeat protein n=1 Tax=Caenorhabditis bovis TaxID=2654633 RepID=A0A8S1DZN6_9PELO|nr:unnamed protein product [Caenorhabditis bovis]